MYLGANLANSILRASTRSSMGALTFASKISLRGWNHSRSLLRARPRKNVMASGGNPGNTVPLLYNGCQMLFRLVAIPNLHVFVNASLTGYTRFEIGGPARMLADASTEAAFIEVSRLVQESGWRHTIIGGG